MVAARAAATGTMSVEYRVSLGFTVRDPTRSGFVQEFLWCLGDILVPICQREICMKVMSVVQPSLTHLVLDLSVEPPAGDGLVDDETMRRFGIADPVGTRADTTLMLWLNSLRRLGAGPLQAAWEAHWRQRFHGDAGECPVFILTHGFRRLAAKVDVAAPAPAPQYDGTQEASA